jgi:hypothetical protein
MNEPLDYAKAPEPRRASLAGRIVVGIGATLAVVVLYVILDGVMSMRSHSAGRAVAKQAHCANQLTALREAMRLYAAENRGRPPPDWARLMFTVDAVPEVLVCPASDDVRSDAKDEAALRADVAAGGHCSFAYLQPTARLADLPADQVVAFELAPNHADGGHALFGDGTVRLLDPATLATLRKRFDAGERAMRL